MEKMQFSQVLSELWALISRSNKYIDETAPWVLAKDESNRAQLDSVMNHLAESLCCIAIMLQPFMTHAPNQMVEQLGLAKDALKWLGLEKFANIPAGTKVVKKGVPIFPRLEMEVEIEYIRGLMQGSKKDESVIEKPEVEEISIDDFMKTELRVAEILEAEKVKKSDKLLKLQIALGYEKRQVVSGIAAYYKPEDLVGKKVICVTNLKPVKLCGELSEGMILAGGDGQTLKVIFADPSLTNGSKVK